MRSYCLILVIICFYTILSCTTNKPDNESTTKVHELTKTSRFYNDTIENITEYKSVSFYSLIDSNEYYSFRRFKVKKFADTVFYLCFNTNTLESKILIEGPEGLVKNYKNVPDSNSTFSRLKKISLKNNKCCHNSGITDFPDKKPIVISIDLCPSPKPIDKELFKFLIDTIATGNTIPVTLCMSGQWVIKHKEDLGYLKKLENANKITITWVNHCNKHSYKKGLSLDKNFLLLDGTDLESEIFETEKIFLENGITPTCFIRFPGLVSNPDLLNRVLDMGLLPVGTAAWIANKVKPKSGDILLLHGNGNEPAGLRELKKLYRNEQLNFEITDLNNLCL